MSIIIIMLKLRDLKNAVDAGLATDAMDTCDDQDAYRI